MKKSQSTVWDLSRIGQHIQRKQTDKRVLFYSDTKEATLEVNTQINTNKRFIDKCIWHSIDNDHKSTIHYIC